MIIANSYPTRTRGIMVNYQMINDMNVFFIRKQLSFYYTHNICIFAYAKEFQPNQRSEQYFSQVKKKNVRLESRTKYFTCAKNDTSNQKPPQCVSFAPSLPLFMGTVSSVLELLCTPETSLRASFPERSGVRKGKGRRACNYVSKI